MLCGVLRLRQDREDKRGARTLLEDVNTLLCSASVGTSPAVLFLLGSSGCGKTLLCKALQQHLNRDKSEVLFFDSVGVPSEEEMVKDFGSGENWQRVTTHDWVRKIADRKDKALIVFEGQYRPDFVTEILDGSGIDSYLITVVTCAEAVWSERLRQGRQQPELVTEDMRNWARFLREKTVEAGGSVIDTSCSEITANLQDVGKLLLKLLNARKCVRG